MKYRTKFLCLLLSGMTVLSLAACSGGENADEATPSPSDSAEPSSDSIPSDDFTVDTSVEDLCLATADIPGNFELFTVNGVPVTAYFYLYFLSDSFSLSSGDTEHLKEDALNAAAYYTLSITKARELGFDMTQDQIDELDSTIALSATMMGGQEAFEDTLRKVGLDYDTFYHLGVASYCYEQLRDGLYAGRPTDEELDTYIEENDILYAKHILLLTVDPSTMEPLDEATIAEKKAVAESLLSQLQASADLTADFDALMNEYSEDTGLTSYPDGYTFTVGQMDAAFESATRALEFGQISDLVESSFGYHIILRLDPATETIRQEYRESLLNVQMQDWLSEADIALTDEYEALDAQLFWERYVAYQNAFAAEASAVAPAD